MEIGSGFRRISEQWFACIGNGFLDGLLLSQDDSCIGSGFLALAVA